MRSRSVALCFAAPLAILLSTRPAAAGGENPADQRIDALVRDLGSEKFATREEASRQLLELGIVTRGALERAAADPDAEVRIRARSILAAVRQSDFEARLAKFLADFDGETKQELPAWEEFSQRYGTNRLARELFVEMQRSEAELLEALAEGPKPASEALARRTQEILDGQRESLMNLGTLASLLFVGCTEGVTVDERRCVHLYPYVVHAAAYRHGKSALWPAVLKKMVAQWLVHDTTPLVANQNLIFATQLEMKPEALVIAQRVLADGNSVVNARLMAIRVIGQFGEGTEFSALEPKLTDADVCFRVDQPQGEVQVRDVALVVLLKATGQKPGDYGCLASEGEGGMPVPADSLVFADDKTRQSALARWAQWRTDHPGPLR